MSRKTRTRLEGMKELGVTFARKNPAVDIMLTAKEGYESAYKIAKGKNPPSLLSEWKNLPGHIRRAEKERLPPGVAAAEREGRRIPKRFR